MSQVNLRKSTLGKTRVDPQMLPGDIASTKSKRMHCDRNQEQQHSKKIRYQGMLNDAQKKVTKLV